MPRKKFILARCEACLASFMTRQAPTMRARFCSKRCQIDARTAALQQERRALEATCSRAFPPPPGSSWLAVTSGQKRFVFALVDDDVYLIAIETLWGLSTRGYVFARRVGQGRASYLHHLVTGERSETDHINRDQLDNRRSNLRSATHSQNLANVPKHPRNTSGYRGVKWQQGKWVAQISANGIRYHLGRFDDVEEAARARDRAARELHGAFAQLNFPDGESSCS